jgi:hypothetical protein
VAAGAVDAFDATEIGRAADRSRGGSWVDPLGLWLHPGVEGLAETSGRGMSRATGRSPGDGAARSRPGGRASPVFAPPPLPAPPPGAPPPGSPAGDYVSWPSPGAASRGPGAAHPAPHCRPCGLVVKPGAGHGWALLSSAGQRMDRKHSESPRPSSPTQPPQKVDRSRAPCFTRPRPGPSGTCRARPLPSTPVPRHSHGPSGIGSLTAQSTPRPTAGLRPSCTGKYNRLQALRVPCPAPASRRADSPGGVGTALTRRCASGPASPPSSR